MNLTLQNWIEDVSRDKLVIAPDNVSSEIRANCWSFKLPQSDDITIDSVIDFFNTILENRSAQVTSPMTYYVWFDAMSGQIKCCIASITPDRLPFRCKVVLVERLEEVVSLYFSSDSPGVVPFSEFKEISIEEAFTGEDPAIKYELKVWCKEIISRLN